MTILANLQHYTKQNDHRDAAIRGTKFANGNSQTVYTETLDLFRQVILAAEKAFTCPCCDRLNGVREHQPNCPLGKIVNDEGSRL